MWLIPFAIRRILIRWCDNSVQIVTTNRRGGPFFYDFLQSERLISFNLHLKCSVYWSSITMSYSAFHRFHTQVDAPLTHVDHRGGMFALL